MLARGTVMSFDADGGLGAVTGPEGDHPFHCTAVSDGSRHIDVGATVVYRIVPGHLGRWEATDLIPVE